MRRLVFIVAAATTAVYADDSWSTHVSTVDQFLRVGDEPESAAPPPSPTAPDVDGTQTVGRSAPIPSSTPETPRERVLSSMRRSVHAFEPLGDAAQEVRDVLNGPVDQVLGRLLVLNGRLFGNSDVAGKKEAGKFLAMVLHALQRNKSANVAFIHRAGATRRCLYRYYWEGKWKPRGSREVLAPTTFAAKKDVEQECGILVPNPYFVEDTVRAAGFGNYLRDVIALEKAAATTPFASSCVEIKFQASRGNRAFWRGKLRTAGKDCASEIGNYARFEAMTLTLRHPDLFDVKASFGSEIPQEWRNASWLRHRGCLDVKRVFGAKGNLKNLVSRIDDAIDQVRYSQYEDYAAHKLLLNMPGGTRGLGVVELPSLRRRRPRLDVVIAQWNQTTREHYFAGLEDGVSHTVVDVFTAKKVSQRILGDEALARRLREGAATVNRDLVCPTCLLDYISETLRTLRDHFRSDLALDSREALQKTLRGVSCSRLGLVELILEKQHGSSVVAVPLDPAKTLPDVGEDETCLALVDAVYPPDAAAAEAWSRKVALLVFLCLALADALLPEQGRRRRAPRLVASLVFVYLMK